MSIEDLENPDIYEGIEDQDRRKGKEMTVFLKSYKPDLLNEAIDMEEKDYRGLFRGFVPKVVKRGVFGWIPWAGTK